MIFIAIRAQVIWLIPVYFVGLGLFIGLPIRGARRIRAEGAEAQESAKPVETPPVPDE